MSAGSFAQNTYDVSWGTGTYDTLSNFTSLVNGMPYMPFDAVSIDPGFDFPFYGDAMDSIVVYADGYTEFPYPSGEIFLFAADGFELHTRASSSKRSDWRYQITTERGLDVLKIEWRNVGIMEDIESNSPSDHSINYQAWFFENGDIEVHFGDFDLANTKYFSDTAGFIDSGGDSYGPWLGIADSLYNDVYYVSGYDSALFRITEEDSSDIFYGIPQKGRYVRFTNKKPIGINDIPNPLSHLRLYPNPTTNFIKIELDDVQGSDISQIDIFDLNGKLMAQNRVQGRASLIDLTGLPRGFYTLSITNTDGQQIHRRIARN